MISFFVNGIPKPAGSKRIFPIRKAGLPTGKFVVTDDCKTSRDWKTDVKFTAQRFYSGPLLEGPLSVLMVFHMPRPKAHFGSGKNAAIAKDSAPAWPITKPDLLKCVRAVEDSLTGILWRDDSQIVQETLEKRYSPNFGVYLEIQSAVAPSVDTLIADGIRAAEGAQVSIESAFAAQDRDPSNSDNYCRLMDWLKTARQHQQLAAAPTVP